MQPQPVNLLPKDGETLFFPQFFAADESARFYEHLLTAIAWRQEPIKLFGKEVMQPRLTAWYGDEGMPYSYSGITMQPDAWTPPLLEIKGRVEAVAGRPFTSALLNQYRDGRDSVGWHRDDEPELGANPVIASVSFGAPRNFRFRHAADKTLQASVVLTNGSLLLMQGATQHHWLHSIPKTTTIHSPRVNITFRTIVP